MVFTPANPKLYRLNLNAWLILELCQGRTRPALTRAYLEAVPAASDARARLREGLTSLIDAGIVERSNEKDRSRT
ncbi:MAG: PqqD family peptide modification chaperone [Alphaproteobacteria bacterium]